MFSKRTLRDVDVRGKRVLVRVDYNVPIGNDGRVTDDTRILASLPTVRYLAEHGAKTILVTHLGRPEGQDPSLRVDAIADTLARFLAQPVHKLDGTVSERIEAAVQAMNPGDVILLENIRFHDEEKKNDPMFARKLADLADLYVNDAFGTAHRAHASTVGVPQYLPAVAGFLLEREIVHLSKLLENPARPFFAVLGGNKISDKLGVITSFCKVVDELFLGGGMCFTFLKAAGYEIGDSLLWEDYLDQAREVLAYTRSNGCRLHLPVDIVCAQEIAPDTPVRVVTVEEGIPSGWRGLDIGPQTQHRYRKAVAQAATVFWNGPMGVFEVGPFAAGTRSVCEALADSRGTTIVGGGDSDAALREFGYVGLVSFVSTGGGASLKFLEGSELPGLSALEEKVPVSV